MPHFTPRNRLRCGAAIRTLIAVAVAAAFLFASPPPALAERKPDEREAASHVVVGVVDAVFERAAKEQRQFIVRIRVERVEKGDGVAAGEFFHVYCFQRRASGSLLPDEAGHRAVPAEGQRIRAYVHRRAGRWEGNYPEWFDVVKGK